MLEHSKNRSGKFQCNLYLKVKIFGPIKAYSKCHSGPFNTLNTLRKLRRETCRFKEFCQKLETSFNLKTLEFLFSPSLVLSWLSLFMLLFLLFLLFMIPS